MDKQFYHFRCHTDGLCLEDLVTFLKLECDVICIVSEQGTRPHIHATLKPRINKNTFISRLKSKFSSIKGNADYSCSTIRKFDENLKYCYKGTANDYPDVLYSSHTFDEQKQYYIEYWQLQSKILSDLKTKRQKKEFQNVDVSGNEIVTTTRRVRTRTFMEKLRDELMEEHLPLVKSLWYHTACKYDMQVNYVPINNLKYCQDYLYNYFKKNLGKSVKNMDDFILERMFRGLYTSLLEECPMPITHKKNEMELNLFRHKL